MRKLNVKDMVLCALFAAICCLCSIIKFPVFQIAVTLATFGVMATALILGIRRGLIAVVLFILIGAIGVPVFSVGGGIGALAGPTGGYIYSYIPMVIIIGFASKYLNKTLKSTVIPFVGCLAAIVILYTLGTVHFMMVTDKTTLYGALSTCVFPFIPFDLAKAILAVAVALRIKSLCK